MRADGSGALVALRGGAYLEVIVLTPAYDASGNPPYRPGNRTELVNVAGHQTLRQVPFRVFTLDGPGSASRVVLDVAHRW
ncbi:AMIN-like domain-containing (lipo)protein [Rhodococcus sp. 2H158]